MLDHEYKKLREAREPRSWPLTLLSFAVSLIVLAGIIATFKYVGHGGLIIFAVIIPAAFICLTFLMAGINGRKNVVKEAFDALLSIAVLWP